MVTSSQVADILVTSAVVTSAPSSEVREVTSLVAAPIDVEQHYTSILWKGTGEPYGAPQCGAPQFGTPKE